MVRMRCPAGEKVHFSASAFRGACPSPAAPARPGQAPQAYAPFPATGQPSLSDQTGAPMPEDIIMIAARNLQQRRQKAGLTQRKVARLLGLKTETICRMEKGHNPASLRRLQQFADLYGCTVIDLLQPPRS